MRKNAIVLSCLAVGLLCCTTMAFADVGQLSCTSAAGTTPAASVSYFDIGIANPVTIGSGSGGAGAGKVKFNPVDIHIPLADFTTFLAFVEEGTTFTNCKITSQNGPRTTEYEFKLAVISSIDAVSDAGAARNDSFTDIKIEFGGLEVQTSTLTRHPR